MWSNSKFVTQRVSDVACLTKCCDCEIQACYSWNHRVTLLVLNVFDAFLNHMVLWLVGKTSVVGRYTRWKIFLNVCTILQALRLLVKLPSI